MSVTLVLARNPLEELTQKGLSGRWGKLWVVKGPKVVAAKVTSSATGSGGGSSKTLEYNGNFVELTLAEGAIEDIKEYTSMERFRANNGKGFYVQIRPRPHPYPITKEKGNPVVKTLRTGHDGRCFRVHGGATAAERGILIHEAPTVDYLIGCISPRPKDNKAVFKNAPKNPSAIAMDEIWTMMEGPSEMFVLDW